MPLGPRAVNAYLVPLESGGYMLVDGGVNTDEAWVALDEGVRARTSWAEVRLHFATHMHQDHIGLNHRVREAAGPPLVMGELDAARMAHAAADPGEEARYRQALLKSSGVPQEILERAISFSPGESAAPFVPADVKLESADRTMPIAPEWQAIWTPGHTAGHTALFRETDRVLMAGDAVLPEIEPTIGVNRQRKDPVADHLQSLDRLLGLSPLKILGGHGEPLSGTERITASAEALRRGADRTLASLGRGGTAWEINVHVHSHRHLRTGALLHELRGTLAHLEHHLLGGVIEVEEIAGVRHFRVSSKTA